MIKFRIFIFIYILLLIEITQECQLFYFWVKTFELRRILHRGS